MSKSISVLCCFLLASFFVCGAFGAKQLTIYWGQNSNGKEKDLSHYCSDSTYDIINIGFVIGFPTAPGDTLPWMNLADHCETQYPGHPYLLSCPDVGEDILYCQQQGKKIFLSFGGAVGSYGFASDAIAQNFATNVWNMFLGGSSLIRPFGSNVVFDGVDLDIEGGATTGYAAFVTALRTYFNGASKPYYISAAPQCVYPDGWLGPDDSRYHNTAFQNAWFDYIWVQFYNNYCGLNAYPDQFNFNSWANWAKTTSKNPNVQIFIGAPASPGAAGSGYVSAATLNSIASDMTAQYGDTMGGIMLWDCANSESNNNFGQSVAALLKPSSPSNPTPAPKPLTTSKPLPATTAKVAPLTTQAKSLTTSQAKSLTTSQAKPLTTSQVRSLTTSQAKPLTTGKIAASTTGKTNAPPAKPLTTAAQIVSVATTANGANGPNVVPPSGSACNDEGNMICASSETYQTCSRGVWQQQQSCQKGLTCKPSGKYIYCT